MANIMILLEKYNKRLHVLLIMNCNSKWKCLYSRIYFIIGVQCGNDSFICSDHTCISPQERCDTISNCDEEEDEHGCGKASFSHKSEKL